MKGVLHQLSGELYQARRGPGDLERAAQEFEKVSALGDKTDGGATCAWLRSTSSEAVTMRPWRESNRSATRARGGRPQRISPC